MGPTVTGAPYSGEEVSENVKTLADGTRLTQKMMARKVWRDAEGRTRTERPLGMGPNQAAMPLIIEITDPVAAPSGSDTVRVTWPSASVTPRCSRTCAQAQGPVLHSPLQLCESRLHAAGS
jgi:hypothetical protein